MLSREDITDSEFAFLASQKIRLTQVFDARGRGPTTFKEEAKAEGLLFGMAQPCKAGHRLFTRSGHCIQCDTSKIAFIRRHSDAGYIYIAASKKGSLLKVGSTSDVASRSSTLNTEGGYGGFDDWEIIAHAKTKGMGSVEFEVHKSLGDLSLSKEYVRAGRNQVTRELLRGDLRRVWKAYQAAIKKVPQTDRWQHRGILAFDFGAK